MIVQKYVAALTSITIVVLSALIAIPSGQLNWTAGLQLAGIGVAAVVTYLSPLLNISWKGILKTGAAILAALFTAALPIVQTVQNGEPFKPIYIAIIVLAAVNALGVEVGVAIRTDTSAVIGADPVQTETAANQDDYQGQQPDYFAVGAGLQAEDIFVDTTTADYAAVNPANQE